MEDGDVYVFGEEARGAAAVGAATNPNLKITSEILNRVAVMVDQYHSEGKAVVAQDVIAFILQHYNFLVHRRTVGRIMNRMGLTWTAIKTARRTYSAYRVKAIRDYLKVAKYNTMFPHFLQSWVNAEGNGISSHILLLPSACTKDQIAISVIKITKTVKITFSFQDKMMDIQMVMALMQLEENHAKFTSFMSIFVQVKDKLNGKPKTSEMSLKLPFEVEKEPLSIQITYYLKGQEYSSGVLINHVLYILTNDFITKRHFKVKTEIGGGDLFGFN